MLKRKSWLGYPIILILIFLSEVLFFNWGSVRSMGYQMLELKDFFTVSEQAVPTGQGNNTYTVNGTEFTIAVQGIDIEVNNLFFNMDFEDSVVPYDITLSDEGNAVPYRISRQFIVKGEHSSQYAFIHPYGKARSLSITFSVKENSSFSFQGIAINAKRPFDIKPVRIAVLFVLCAFCYMMRKGSRVHDILLQENSRWQYIVMAGFTLVTVMVVLWMTGINREYWKNSCDLPYYYDLTSALSKGHFYLDMEPDKSLMELENPYDYSLRDSRQIPFAWDTAYYDGKYYCYFGIVPVLLSYLPYYHLTGKMLSNVVVHGIFSVLLVLGSVFLIRQLLRVYCSKPLLYLWPLLSVVTVFSESYVYLYARSDFYNIPILAANVLIIWGIGFWLLGKARKKGRKAAYFMGSFCMALVAGCRPQMALISFLAVAIFWDEVIVRRTLFSKKYWKDTLAIVFPYLPVAMFLMYYNYCRFDSVFNFGASYNLTTNDMTRRGVNSDRLWCGFLTFLILPPVILGTFPYVQGAVIASEYMGKAIIEYVYGGVFIVNAVFWIVPVAGWFKDTTEKYKIRLFLAFSLALTLCLGAIDATIAGVLQRYTGDFCILPILMGCLLVAVVTDDMKLSDSKGYTMVTGFLRIAVLVTVIYGFLTIFNNTGDSRNLIATNGEFYFRVRSYFML